MEKYQSTHSFFFMGHAFLKENSEDRVKLLGSNALNWCLKITTANLLKIGLKMNNTFHRT